MKLTLIIITILFSINCIQCLEIHHKNNLQFADSSSSSLCESDERELKSLQNEFNIIAGFFHYVKNEDKLTGLNQIRFKESFVRANTKKEDKSSSGDQQAQNHDSFPVQSGLSGPKGQACANQEECNKKNKQFYSSIKKALSGLNGANGEKGPKGKDGKQGQAGKLGVKGADGVSPLPSTLQRLTKKILQQELAKTSSDEILYIEQLNTDYIFETIFYGAGTNCKAQRDKYRTVCAADRDEFCSSKNHEDCCPKKTMNQCGEAADELVCCFQTVPMPDYWVRVLDMEQGSNWLDGLTFIDKQQGQYITMNENGQQAIPHPVLKTYRDRIHYCRMQGLEIIPKCLDKQQ